MVGQIPACACRASGGGRQSVNLSAKSGKSAVPTPEELIADNIELLTLPEVCLQVQDMADDPACSTADLGQIISHDPALTTLLLKLINSAYYGLPTPVETASRAISLLGIQELKNLVLSVSVAEVFARIPPGELDMVSFWRHSVFCGLVARRLARRSGVLHDERLFVAGLLHDMGRVLLLSRLPEQAAEIVAAYARTPVCEAERAVIGFDHAELGAVLMQHWRLPSALCEAVACHHVPARAQGAEREAAIVHLANVVTDALERWENEMERRYYDPYAALLNAPAALQQSGGGDRPVSTAPERALAQAERGWEERVCQDVDARVWPATGLTPAVLPTVVREAAQGFDQVLDVIYPVPYPL